MGGEDNLILLYLFIGFCLGAAFVVFWMVALSDKLQRIEETITYKEIIQKNWEELSKYEESLDIIKARADGYENAGEHDMASGLRLAIDILERRTGNASK